VLFGDVITARAEVIEVLRERNRMRLKTVCTNQRGEDVLTGEALVMPSKVPVAYEERVAPGERARLPCGRSDRGRGRRRAPAILGMLGLSTLSALAGAAVAEKS
jgi:hypothetical protein